MRDELLARVVAACIMVVFLPVAAALYIGKIIRDMARAAK